MLGKTVFSTRQDTVHCVPEPSSNAGLGTEGVPNTPPTQYVLVWQVDYFELKALEKEQVPGSLSARPPMLPKSGK